MTPKIIQIVTGINDRIIALADNGKAYWFYSSPSSGNPDQWIAYSDLPESKSIPERNLIKSKVYKKSPKSL